MSPTVLTCGLQIITYPSSANISIIFHSWPFHFIEKFKNTFILVYSNTAYTRQNSTWQGTNGFWLFSKLTIGGVSALFVILLESFLNGVDKTWVILVLLVEQPVCCLVLHSCFPLSSCFMVVVLTFSWISNNIHIFFSFFPILPCPLTDLSNSWSITLFWYGLSLTFVILYNRANKNSNTSNIMQALKRSGLKLNCWLHPIN